MQIELNEHTRAILGRPNFKCIAIAHHLRTLGHDIPNKSEDEQAAVIAFLLNTYLEHGDNWLEKANEILRGANNNTRDTSNE